MNSDLVYRLNRCNNKLALIIVILLHVRLSVTERHNYPL